MLQKEDTSKKKGATMMAIPNWHLRPETGLSFWDLSKIPTKPINKQQRLPTHWVSFSCGGHLSPPSTFVTRNIQCFGPCIFRCFLCLHTSDIISASRQETFNVNDFVATLVSRATWSCLFSDLSFRHLVWKQHTSFSAY